MKTISILNLKGGVAKTFTAANMAYELYRRGYKVLLIDNDKQGNLSKAYSRYDAENVAPVTRLLAGDWENADELIQHTEYEGIDIVTANMSLFGATWNLTKEDSENQIPFNAVAVDGEYDRVYKAEDWAWYFATFIANGIFPKPSDGLQVVAYSGMEIRVNAGYAFINGYAFRNPATLSVTLDTAEGALNRVDRVVVRWDLPQRDMYIAVLKGTPSAKPTATAVTRTTEIWELALADIYVGKGVTRIQTQNITDQRFNSAVCGIVTGTVEEIDASVLTKQFTDFFNTYSAAVLDEFSAYKQSMEKYLTEIAGVYDSYVSKTEGLFAQYESQFNERYSSFESTLDNWDKELLSAYTEFMAKIKLFQSDAENEFNTWFESIKDKLGEDIAGSLQLQIEELAAAMQEVKKQAEAGTKETKEAIAALDERLKRVESGWGIDYKHDAVLGLCYMGAAYMSQHYERTVETAVLGATYVGNSYLANTF